MHRFSVIESPCFVSRLRLGFDLKEFVDFSDSNHCTGSKYVPAVVIICRDLPKHSLSGRFIPGGILVHSELKLASIWSYCFRYGCLLMLMVASSGCHVVFPGKLEDGPKPCVPQEMPREHAKVTMPDYIIEPPDILTIEAISLVPKAPYKLRSLDVVSIFSSGLPEEEAIAGEYTLQPNGTIQLGHSFGTIHAIGISVEELQEKILTSLKQKYKEPTVWVTLLQMGAQQQIIGEHLVAPDGKVNLGTYGRVRLVGLTIEEAQAKVQTHLSKYLESPEIALDVYGYNSKVFYVITQGAGLGDQVVILPSRGNETVLDAIGQIQGLQSNSSTRMWIARPGYNNCGGDQILPIDWLAVTQRGDIKTNYQILPGDRLYVSEDKLVALDTALGKIMSPFERLFGVTLLGTQTAQRIVFFGDGPVGGGGF
jgi:polysaccharide export outer membrane protein